MNCYDNLTLFEEEETSPQKPGSTFLVAQAELICIKGKDVILTHCRFSLIEVIFNTPLKR